PPPGSRARRTSSHPLGLPCAAALDWPPWRERGVTAYPGGSLRCSRSSTALDQWVARVLSRFGGVMRVAEVFHPGMLSCAATDSLEAAAAKMNSARVGALAVLDG